MKLRQAKLLFLALLLAAGGNLLAQREGPANDSYDGGPVVEPHIEAPPPPEPPPVDNSSSVSPDTPVTDTPDSPAPEEPSDDRDGRYAVPVTEPVEPHRQRPHRGRQDDPEPPSGGDDDYDVPEETPDESYTAYEDEETYSSPGGGGPMRPVLGAVDLDLSPGRTQVYLDGSYLGVVDQFDGWPAYLLLPEGSYELVFYLDGYRTMARRVAILPGTVIKMNDRLERGPSIRPEEFFSR